MLITLTLDGQETRVEKGTTLLAAAQEAGIAVPSLCKHEHLDAVGRCRLCMVERRTEEGSRLVMSCRYQIKERDEGAEMLTESEKAVQHRKGILTTMMARWPNVPAVKELAARYGVERPATLHAKANLDENACIRCGICLQACRQIKKQKDIIVWVGKDDDLRVAMPGDVMNPNCFGCGICASACPQGAITFDHSPNNDADFDAVRKVAWAYSWEILTLDPGQNEMAVLGTTHLIPIMNDHDCLPVRNFQFGCDDEAVKLDKEAFRPLFDPGFDGCWAGCAVACAHGIKNFVLKTGPFKGQKVFVDGPEYETIAGMGSNCGIFDPAFVVEGNFYCDTYGIDTISVGTGMAFVMECFERGLIDASHTGGLELRFGNQEAFLKVIHQAAQSTGFGKIFGQGIRRMKKIFAEEFGADPAMLQDIGMESKGLEFSEYITKESLAQQGGYGIALKGPQHDEAWLIFLDMVHNYMPTFEDKAEALHWFPMWRTWFSLNGLCKLPWNDIVPVGNENTPEPAKVTQHLKNYARFFSGVTGIESEPDDLVAMSEKVYNFQRVFNLRLGFGTREHDSIPYRAAGPVTAEEYESRADRYDGQLREKVGIDPAGKTTAEKIALLRTHREGMYEKLLDAVYTRRGWTADGVPTLEKVKALGIDFPDVCELLSPHQKP